MNEFGRLALHTWTLDTTPLETVIAAAKAGGFDAVELRRIDFKRLAERGIGNTAALDLVRAGGMPVSMLGCEYGWFFASGAESERLFDDLARTADNAVALGCSTIMTAVGGNSGPIRDAIENLKRGADIVGERGLGLAVEFSFQHEVIGSIAALRELIDGAGRKNAGMLLDTYHLERSGAGGRGFADVAPAEIAAVQFSDVPAAASAAGDQPPIDRLPPGKGIVRWLDVFGLLKEKGYDGYLSFEGPNAETWARPPLDVAREAVAATRTLIAQA